MLPLLVVVGVGHVLEIDEGTAPPEGRAPDAPSMVVGGGDIIDRSVGRGAVKGRGDDGRRLRRFVQDHQVRRGQDVGKDLAGDDIWMGFLSRRRWGIVRRGEVGVGLPQPEGSPDGPLGMPAADGGEPLGADGVVLLVDDGRVVAGVSLPLPVQLVEDGVAQGVALGQEGLEVVGRQHVLQAAGAVPVVVVAQLHLVDGSLDVFQDPGLVVLVVVKVRKLLVRHGREGGDGDDGRLGIEAKRLHGCDGLVG